MRSDGAWEAWLGFFLEGVRETADGAVTTARRLVALFGEDRERVQVKGRLAGSALRVHEALQARPVTTLSQSCAKTGLSFPAATAGMSVLVELGIARELTGRRRDRVFAYDRYLATLQEGTEPL